MKFLNDDWRYQNKKEFWGAVISTVGSMILADKAADRADSLADKANLTREERLAVAQKSYDNYKETFGPNEQALVDMVDNFTMRDNLQKYREEGVVNVNKAMNKSLEMQKRDQTRYGLDPSDRRYQANQRELGIERAKGEVGALNRARTQAEEERLQDEDRLFSRRLAVGQFGRQPITAERDLSVAYGNQLSDLRGEEAGYAKQAGEGYGLAGKFAAKAEDSFSGWGDSGSNGNKYFNGSTGSSLGEGAWEGSNYVSNADTGDLGW